MISLSHNRITTIWRMLPSQIHGRSLVVLIMTIIGAGAELMGLGMILPVLSVLLTPNNLANFALPISLYEWLTSLRHEMLVITAMACLLVIYFIKATYLAFLSWIQASYAYDIKAIVSDELLSNYLNADYEFHLKENSAQMIRNITVEVEQFVSNAIVPAIKLISELFIVVSISGLLIYVNPTGSIYMGLIICGSMFMFHKLTKGLLIDWGQRRQHSEGRRIQLAQEALGGSKDAKLLNREEWFLSEYSKSNWLSSRMARNQLALSQLPYLWLEIIAIGALAFVVIHSIASGTTSSQIIPMIGLFGAAAFRIIPSANRILMALQALKYATPVIQLMSIETARKHVKPPKAGPLLDFFEEVTLSQVSYQYPDRSKSVLDAVSLIFKKGETVGIIGNSGAGKSTLINLILGLTKPSSGTIKVDGIDVQTNLRGWQANIGYVPQQIFLIDDTLRRNIAFGMPDSEINDEDLDRAISQAQLTEFVSSLEDGLETRVGERGVRLSGGQLQRTGIARALYKKPKILLLDEASSALDVGTEDKLIESIHRLSGEVTIIIVTHRYSSLKGCQKIYKIDAGKVENVRKMKPRV